MSRRQFNRWAMLCVLALKLAGCGPQFFQFEEGIEHLGQLSRAPAPIEDTSIPATQPSLTPEK